MQWTPRHPKPLTDVNPGQCSACTAPYGLADHARHVSTHKILLKKRGSKVRLTTYVGEHISRNPPGPHRAALLVVEVEPAAA